MKKQTYINIIASLFILLFLYAAVTKLMEYDKFTTQLGKSPLIMGYSTILAWLVPVVEIGIALLLIFPRTTLLGLYSSMAIMAMFTLYITFIMTLSPYVPCSCGGILSQMGWEEHLVFNIAFTLLGIVGIYLKANTSDQSQQHTIVKTA
jgi:uncharacterized membrane protein YphA (DoxX/SURF4 family)